MPITPQSLQQGQAPTRRPAGTVNLAPKWEALVPLLIERAGKGDRVAIEEITNLAKFADSVNADADKKLSIPAFPSLADSSEMRSLMSAYQLPPSASPSDAVTALLADVRHVCDDLRIEYGAVDRKAHVVYLEQRDRAAAFDKPKQQQGRRR